MSDVISSKPPRCPHCRQLLPSEVKATGSPGRICARCDTQILRHDKFTFGPDGRLRHRHCDNPESYLTPADEALRWPGGVAKHAENRRRNRMLASPKDPHAR